MRNLNALNFISDRKSLIWSFFTWMQRFRSHLQLTSVIIFITFTDCTTFHLMLKQTFDDIESWSHLSLIFRCWKMSHEANSSLSHKISSSLIISSDDKSISLKVHWDKRRILINSELLSSSLMSSWSSRSSLDSNIMNSTWYKKYVFYRSSSSCKSFDVSINDAKQVSAYESDNENSQMQYFSQVNISIDERDKIIIFITTTDCTMFRLTLKQTFNDSQMQYLFQVNISTDERNKTVIFITTTDCTMFHLTLKQTFNDSQMQYFSSVNIVTSSTETSVFASKDEHLTCSNLKSVCWKIINSLISYH